MLPIKSGCTLLSVLEKKRISLLTPCVTLLFSVLLPPIEEFIFSFASSATKKLSESVVGTAQTIKKTVEEGKIDGIIDKALCSSGLWDF